MTTTKNTTAIERRIARRESLAATLKTLAVSIEKLGASGDLVREAATELLIGNTELVLGQDWATDPKPALPPNPTKPMFAEAGRLMREMQPDLERHVATMIGANVRKPVALPPGARFVPGTPEVTDEMVDRAVEGYDAYTCGYTGSFGPEFCRASMRFALEQALWVQP